MTGLSLSAILDQYGYYILLFGNLLEGETVVVLAGFAARRGLLLLQWVIVIAAVGGFIGDQIFFWLGRRRKEWLFAHWPKLEMNMTKASSKIETYGPLAIVLSRFVYGMRVASGVAFGISTVSAQTYLIFNLIGACIWAVTMTLIGYFFGAMAEKLLADVVHYEEYLLLAILVAGASLMLWNVLRKRES